MTRSHNSRRGSKGQERSGGWGSRSDRCRRRCEVDGIHDLADEVDLHDEVDPYEVDPYVLYEVDGPDVDFEIDFEIIGIDRLSSASDSEWSVVTAAETSWAVVTPAELCGSPWPDTSNDEAIARALWQQERGPLRPKARWEAVFPAVHGAGSASTPSLPTAVKDDLVDQMGVCVVCSESITTVIMEPCGHLALCATCHGAWAQRTCVLCRTPGVGVHMLPAPSGCVSSGHGVDIRLLDGAVSIPLLEPSHEDDDTRKNRNYKLELRRRMRDLTRLGRTRSRRGMHADWSATPNPSPSVGAGGMYAKRAREAAAAYQWVQYGESLAKWRHERRAVRHAALARNYEDLFWLARYSSLGRSYGRSRRYYVVHESRVSHAAALFGRGRHKELLRPRPDIDRGFSHRRCSRHPLRQVYHQGPVVSGVVSSHEQRGYVRRKKAELHWAAARESRERKECRLAVVRQAEEARAAARELLGVAEAAACSPTLCLECGDAEACMMALPCRCRSLCSACWHAAPEATQRRKVCGRCGGDCQISLCVYRP